jgi:uncharacterized protein YndB with AHSA1/START domain
MTFAEKTERGQTDTIRFEFELRHTPKKVWRALTDPALLSEWLLPTLDLELERGAEFTFTAPPQPGWGGIVSCQFLEIEPLKKLSYTWRVGEMDTVVTFTLTPTESGTHLLLVHSGFKPHQKQNFGGARYGWRLMAPKLVEVLEKLT